MTTVEAEPLTPQAFAPFGAYRDLSDRAAPLIGAPPVEFYRDLLQLDLGGRTPSFSVCRVEPREPVVDVLEYHSAAAEGVLPLDQGVVLQVAPATAGPTPPLEALRAFRVPRLTLVALRPGVWHHAPFATEGAAASVLIVLPERTYANDTVAVALEPRLRVRLSI